MIEFTRFDLNGRYISSTIGMSESLTYEDASKIYVGPPPGFDHYHDIASNRPVAIPPQPSPTHVFDYISKTWSDPRTLSQRQNDKWATIKAAREAVFDAPVVTSVGTFDSDYDSRIEVGHAVILAQTATAMGHPVNIKFTLADNTTVMLDLQGISNVGLMFGAKVQAARAKATDLRTLIYTAITADQVDAITWPI